MSEQKPSNLGGRPTLYNDQLQKLADEYVDNWNLYLEIKSKDDPSKVTHVVNSIPSIVGLALHLGVHRDSIYNWAKIHEKFIYTLERIKQKQEMFLIHHGLTKGYDSGFAKFLSINVTDYKDKVEVSSTNKNIEINIDTNDSEL